MLQAIYSVVQFAILFDSIVESIRYDKKSEFRLGIDVLLYSNFTLKTFTKYHDDHVVHFFSMETIGWWPLQRNTMSNENPPLRPTIQHAYLSETNSVNVRGFWQDFCILVCSFSFFVTSVIR